MAKHRIRPAAPAVAQEPVGTKPRSTLFRPLDLLGIVAVLLCVVLGFLSRLALSPDGVSYLDLAAAVAHGDWSHFVQGYWSPLYPLLAGIVSAVTGWQGPNLVRVMHGMNTIAALLTVLLLWWWGRRAGSSRPSFGPLAIGGFMLCSAGLPKLEAVTPDILSLLIAVAIAYELLVHNGQRSWRVGVLLGLAFLAKTSAWPWLVVALPLRLWAAPDAPGKRHVWISSAICAGIMLLWIVPMSIKSGRPTIGSSGRLNYSWYVNASRSSQTPDADRGSHAAYHKIALGDGRELTVATFNDAAHWTYQPWGDPTAWASGATSNSEVSPTVGELASYWLRMIGYTFLLWLGPMLLLVVVAAYLLHKRRGVWRELTTTQRPALVVGVLGIVGLLQFVFIHVEPRLIAPPGMMLALGSLWLDTAAPADRPRNRAVTGVLTWGAPVIALLLAIDTLVGGAASTTRLVETTGRLDGLRQQISASVGDGPLVAIVGPAAPVLSAAYWSGVHIAMQMPPASAALLATLPPEQQQAAFNAIFAGRVALIWKTDADGGMEMLLAPRK